MTEKKIDPQGEERTAEAHPHVWRNYSSAVEVTAQARHTTLLNSQAQETGRKQTNTEISHVSLFVHPSLLGALQCSEKKHPPLPSSRILLDAAQILQESRYFCAVSSADQKCTKRTKVANHCVISVGQTVSSKPYGNNGIELQQTQLSLSSLLV